MDRTEYLEMCRKVAVIPCGAGGIKKIPPELHLRYKDMTFYPVAYKLEFTHSGKPSHIAILHDLKVHSIIHCDLLKVERM